MCRYRLRIVAVACVYFTAQSVLADETVTLRELIRRDSQVASFGTPEAKTQTRQRLIAQIKADLPAYLAEISTQHGGTSDAAAADVLGEVGDPRAIPRLIEFLDSSEKYAASNAEVAIVKFGSHATFPLVELLEKQDRRHARAAIRMLGRIGDKRAADPLAKLAEAADSELRVDAACALAALGDKRATSTLIECLYGLRNSRHYAALNALSALGDSAAIEPLLKLLQKGDSQERITAAAALGATRNERCIEPLLIALEKHIVESTEAERKAIPDPQACLPAPDSFPGTVATALAQIGEPATDRLIRALSHSQTEIRHAAAEALLEIGSRRSLAAVAKQLTGDRRVLVDSAIRAYAKLGDREAFGYLVEKLAKLKWDYRSPPAALACLAGQDVKVLVPLLKHDSHLIRSWAAEAIFSIGPADAMPAMLDVYQDPRNASIGAYDVSLRAIAATRHRPAVPVLIENLKSNQPWVATYAARCLGEMGEKTAVNELIAVVNRKDIYSSRASAIEALGKIGDPAAVACLGAALDDKELRTVAAQALEKVRTVEAISALVAAAMADPSPSGDAASALSTIGDSAVDATLAALLAAKSDHERRVAAAILGRIATPSACKALRTAATEHRGKDREHAVENLGAVRDGDAIDLLISILGEDEQPLRLKAAAALGRIGSPAVPRLIVVLNSTAPPQVRLLAAKALGDITDPRAAEPLAKALHDESRQLADAAAWSLVQLSDARGMPWLVAQCRGKTSDRWFVAARGFSMLGANGIDGIVELMRDPQQEVRNYAQSLLYHVTDRRAVVPLTRALRIDDDFVRMHAVAALGRLRAFESADAIFKVMHSAHEPVRLEAAYALAVLGDRRATQVLIHLLGSKDPKARARAASLLGELPDASNVEPLAKALSDDDAYVRYAAVYALIQTGGDRAVQTLQAFVNRTTDKPEQFPAAEALQNPLLVVPGNSASDNATPASPQDRQNAN